MGCKFVELMLLGFISLLITVGQKPISKICISNGAGDTMLPCKKVLDEEAADTGKDKNDSDRRKLLWYAGDALARRVLAAADGDDTDHCSKYVSRLRYLSTKCLSVRIYLMNHVSWGCQKKVPLISQSGIHQLHIFIFVLAVFHVLYSVLTIVLARAKVSPEISDSDN